MSYKMSPRRKPTATAWARLLDLKLRQQVADMRLDGFLGEEEPFADFAVHESVGYEL